MGKRLTLVIVALSASALVFGAAQASATARYVRATGTATAPGTNCGHPGYNTIQSAVSDALPGDTVVVCSGTYAESNIAVDKALTIDGQGNPKVVPAGEDGNINSAVTPPLQNGFVIRSNDVTIQDLTIDGQGNAGLTPAKNNYRTAIITDTNFLLGFDNTTVTDVEIRHVYRRGIQLRGGTGHVLDNNKIRDVSLLDGIVAFEADTAITNNDICEAAEGIGTNYLTVPANAPLVQITGNHISKAPTFGVGMNLSGLADGSLVDSNHIDMQGGGADEIGILVQYAVGTVTVAHNDLSASDGDSGMWLYHNEDPAHPVTVTANKLESHHATDDGVGSATGIFITDDGSFFGDEDGLNYAVITGNQIKNWVTGLHVYRNGHAPLPGRLLVTTANQNCITGNSAWGALVDGTNAATQPNIDATNNWWGAKDGPSGVGPGHGDSVSMFVDFAPWATNASVCKG